MGMVLSRFGHKYGAGFRKRVAHPHPMFLRVPPGPVHAEGISRRRPLVTRSLVCVDRDLIGKTGSKLHFSPQVTHKLRKLLLYFRISLLYLVHLSLVTSIRQIPFVSSASVK